MADRNVPANAVLKERPVLMACASQFHVQADVLRVRPVLMEYASRFHALKNAQGIRFVLEDNAVPKSKNAAMCAAHLGIA